MGVIFVGLLAKLLFASTWRNGKLGIYVMHLGGILLLFGGFLTAAFSQEGAMVIPPNQTASYVSDYHALELAVTHGSSAEQDEVTSFGQGWLKPGKLLSAQAFPFQLEILKYCRNCEIQRRTAPVDPGEYHGFAANFDLGTKPYAKEDHENQAGVMFRVKGAGPGTDGIYAIFEEMPVPQTIQAGGRKYLLEIRKQRTHLPFSLHLIQFEKQVHPGTQMARSYKSTVTLQDGGVAQRAVIQMNEPLRHRGYTFYQSSFVEHPSGDTTILAVVKNAGRTFPYISSIIMCFGLLIHLMIQSPKLIRKR
jgi:cytochrome c biogenesis protein ResB